MNQDELQKEETDVKKENHFPVENEEIDSLKIFSFGGVVIIALCVFFSFINLKRGLGFYEFGAIIFVYLASTLWRFYMFTKNKYYLLLSFLSILGVLVCVFRYIVLV